MVWTVIAYWIVGLPAGCWLCYGLGWGVFGIWWGLCAGLMLVAAGLIPVWYRKSIRWHRLSACARLEQ
jgi:MATE family multidrug resistance protein